MGPMSLSKHHLHIESPWNAGMHSLHSDGFFKGWQNPLNTQRAPHKAWYRVLHHLIQTLEVIRAVATAQYHTVCNFHCWRSSFFVEQPVPLQTNGAVWDMGLHLFNDPLPLFLTGAPAARWERDWHPTCNVVVKHRLWVDWRRTRQICNWWSWQTSIASPSRRYG